MDHILFVVFEEAEAVLDFIPSEFSQGKIGIGEIGSNPEG
jgi:hypothetical protein